MSYCNAIARLYFQSCSYVFKQADQVESIECIIRMHINVIVYVVLNSTRASRLLRWSYYFDLLVNGLFIGQWASHKTNNNLQVLSNISWRQFVITFNSVAISNMISVRHVRWRGYGWGGVGEGARVTGWVWEGGGRTLLLPLSRFSPC